MEVRGASIVITGASSGIGRAMARAFAAEGANVGLIARNLSGLEATADEVRSCGSEALVLPVDVSRYDEVEAAADRVVDEWGRIDVWINNAMVSVFAPVVDVKPEEFRRVTEVNYLGYVHGTLAALRHMRTADRGLVLQICSALAYRSIPLQSAYCASKAAIRGFSDSLRAELIHTGSGVQTCMLQLPAVNTPQFEVVRNRLDKHPQPVPPIYQPEVIADAAVRAVKHPKREVWIGWSAVKAIIGQRVFPGLLDHYLARNAWDAQQTLQLPEGHPKTHDRDNLDAPIPGDRGARGPFSANARTFDSKTWLESHALPFVMAALAIMLIMALFLVL